MKKLFVWLTFFLPSFLVQAQDVRSDSSDFYTYLALVENCFPKMDSIYTTKIEGADFFLFWNKRVPAISVWWQIDEYTGFDRTMTPDNCWVANVKIERMGEFYLEYSFQRPTEDLGKNWELVYMAVKEILTVRGCMPKDKVKEIKKKKKVDRA